MLNNLVAQLGTGAGGSATSFESIATATGTGSSATITFSSIPSTYKHLQIRYTAKTTNAGIYALYTTVNGITSASYAYHQLLGNGSTASANGAGSDTSMQLAAGSGIPGTAYANMPAVGIIDVSDYSSTSKTKTFRTFNGYDLNFTSSQPGYVLLGSGLFNSTNAITSITFTLGASSFATTSTFALYGIK